MLIRLTLVALLVIQASNIWAEEPPLQPPRPIQAYPVQPANGAVVDPDANATKLAVLQQKQRDCEQLQKEIRQLRSELGTLEQYSVRVHVLEVSLTELKRRTTDFSVAGEAGSFQIDGVEGLRHAIIAAGTQSVSSSSTAVTPSSNGFVELLKKNNIAKEIASPTLIVADGRPAKLFTGLEVPVPALATQTPANNCLRPGIEIDLTAFSRENDRVRIDIRGSVRELDKAHSFVAKGTKIPALKTRQFATGLEGVIGEPLVLPSLVETRGQVIKDGNKIQRNNVEIALIAVIIPNRISTPAQAVRTSVGDTVK